jgi:type VI secretion system protein ImpK
MGKTADLGMVGGDESVNSLLDAAIQIFAVSAPLRRLASLSDVEGLRRRLVSEIQLFEQRARAANVNVEELAAARYCLCTFLDEFVSSTPWGSGGVWATRNMLVTFHNEVSGGEKFFLILQKNVQEPEKHLDLLELMYSCIALGFEGKYRLIEGGRDQLATVRERLYQIILKARGPTDAELSSTWKGVAKPQDQAGNGIYLWVGVSVGILALLLAYFVFSLSLSNYSDPTFRALASFKLNRVGVPEKPAPVQQSGRITKFLASDIEGKRVEVRESADLTVITILGDGMFASGGAEASPEYLPLLSRIGDALATTTGQIRVTGHTDDQKIVTARFPSNWELSVGRARAVASLLSAAVGDAARVRFDGQGDLRPIVPNDSPTNRAKNRRVEVTLYGSSSK